MLFRTTIMILNYHHRMADTHNMPDWVSSDSPSRCCLNKQTSPTYWSSSDPPAGQCGLPPVAALAPQDGPAGREDHQEDHHDGQEDEGARHQGNLLQVVALQCSGYGRWFPAIHLAENYSSRTNSPPKSCETISEQSRNTQVRLGWEVLFVVCFCNCEVWGW